MKKKKIILIIIFVFIIIFLAAGVTYSMFHSEKELESVNSNLASFAYYEFNSYTNISNRIVLSFDNMGNKYNSINKEITRIIDKKPLKITEKNLLTVYDNQTKYNFYIIPVEDYDVFMTLRDSNTPYLFSKEIEEPLIALIKGVERKNIIVTEKQTLSILE